MKSHSRYVGFALAVALALLGLTPPLASAQVTCRRMQGFPADDGPSIQACLNLNPGKRVVLPKWTAASVGGGGASNIDYYSSITLVGSGNGQVLAGNTASVWSGGVTIKFASGIPGYRAPSDCYGCGLEDIELRGASCWSGNQGGLPDQFGSGPDGIQLLGGEPVLRNIVVKCFQRNGILVSGDSHIQSNPPSQPDSWRFDRILSVGNLGHGVHVKGGDSNAGVATVIQVTGNQQCGISDQSMLGNVWIAPSAHANGQSYCGKPGISSSYSTWIGPYCEGGQEPPDFGSSSIVVGGNCRVLQPTSGVILAATNHALEVQSRGSKWFNRFDQQNYFDIYAGKTATMDRGFRWIDNSGAVQFSLYQFQDKYFALRDMTSTAWPLYVPHGGDQFITSNPNARLHLQSSGLSIESAGTKPTCYLNTRGTIWVTPGSGGLPDLAEMCLMDSSGSFAWRQLNNS